MRCFSVFAFAVLSLSFASASETPAKISGYVTAVDSSGSFDLEGVHVRTTPATKYSARTPGSDSTTPAAPTDYFLGETLDAIGQLDHRTHTLTATEIVVIPIAEATLHNTAIIDLMPAAPPEFPSSDRIVRADGYLLHITAKTKLNLDPALKSIADVSTNQWIEYSGVQQLDGTIILDYAGVGPNRVNKTEDHLRRKTEYDPKAVPGDAHQSAISKGFIGVDPKRIPAYNDRQMQARVERIGQALIPAYQRALPDSDPTKIHFRFQIIDSNKLHDAWTLSSGVILVPHQVIERMQNDDQLATVLADNIAENLEEDAVRFVSTTYKAGAANVAGTAAEFFVPGVGWATQFATYKVQKHVHDLQLQQSGRVSLCLLQDAGYNITQAPLAWWLLAPKTPTPITETKMPPRAITLYESLGTTWHPNASTSHQQPSTAPKQ